MKLTRILTAAAAVTVFAGGAWAGSHKAPPNGNANGVYGCNSGGAPNAKNPGHWFKALKEHPWGTGLNPAQMAKKENDGAGAGAGNSENVGAFIDYFCGNPS